MPQPESFAKCACQHCGGHIEYPANAAGQSIRCPHCHKPTLLFLTQTEPKRNTLVFIFAAVALLAAAGGGAYFYFGPKKSHQTGPPTSHSIELSNTATVLPATAPLPPPKPKPPPDPWHGLKPSGVTLEKTGDGRLVYAIGLLTNTTTRQRFGVKVALDVLDERHNKIGAATDYTDVIEPGKVWKFRALLTDKNATAAKLTNVREQE